MKKTTLLVAVLMWSSFLFGQTYLDEDFEGATFPPAGWIDVAGANEVAAYNWGISTARSNSGSQSAWYDDVFPGEPNPSVTKHRWLITPVMNLSGATAPKFSYFESVKETVYHGTLNPLPKAIFAILKKKV